MLRTLMTKSLCLVVCFAAFTLNAEVPRTVTNITLNGVATGTYFNDGDTFKILDGDMKNSRVRIAGFNTLETYGPVHIWSGSNPHYLYSLANQATEKAQQGTWTCITDGKKDTYGRLLATCDDLALSLIAQGLAHAYSIDTNPADKKYLDAQQIAISKKIGFWKNGTPEYIVTSLHSADEGAADNYNRLISTKDGTSKRWAHHDTYRSCQRVCVSEEESCMVYVPFQNRYGRARPDCLR